MEHVTQPTWGNKLGRTLGSASGLGVDGHRGWRRFRASDNAGAAAADKRLVPPLLRPFSVPLTAWLIKKYAGITLSGWVRCAIAFLIIVVGRLVLKIEGRGEFLIDPSRCWKEDCFQMLATRPIARAIPSSQ
jgi:hypothetical protein